MTQRDMIYAFCRMGISSQHFWLGAIEKAERVNGMTYNGKNWIVYYREHGRLQHVHEFPSQNEACDELYRTIRPAKGQSTRQIEVHLNYIGQFPIPTEGMENENE